MESRKLAADPSAVESRPIRLATAVPNRNAPSTSQATPDLFARRQPTATANNATTNTLTNQPRGTATSATGTTTGPTVSVTSAANGASNTTTSGASTTYDRNTSSGGHSD